MTTEQFTIRKRPGWGADITVTIECDPLASMGVKLGLAVRVGYSSGANLSGAYLSGANLRGAYLSGANLSGADLRGALVHGEKITRLLAACNRLDGYTFYAFALEAGGVKIVAGCRWFTVAEFRAHIAKEYPGTPKATETGDILDFIEARCRAQSVALEPDQ